MLTLGSLTFAAPWVLAAAILLPALWWLLRVIPPAPRRTRFPAIRLLLGLDTPQRSSARTPLWLVALRIVLAGLVIIGVAHPVSDIQPVGFDGPLLLVVDNGWASAKQWPQRQAAIDGLLTEAERTARPVMLLGTAPPPDGGPIAATGLMPASQARGLAAALRPLPWQTDRAAAAKALSTVSVGRAMRVVWISDGIDDGGVAPLGARLNALGGVQIVTPAKIALPKLLMPPRIDPTGDLVPVVRRVAGAPDERVSVRAADSAGRTLARVDVDMNAGAEGGSARLPMPTELRNRVTRLEIEGENTAGAVELLDERFRRRPVGLVGQGAGGAASPLLNDLYYVEKALMPFAEVRRGPVVDLLKRDISLIVVPDQGGLNEDDRRALANWAQGGGVVLRLAGPQLARSPDNLLPVQLLGTGRTLGGAMSWTQPMSLAPMPEGSPFTGLAIPPDLRVTSQVLAAPTVDLNTKSWARLADGTPLVTGAPLGKGWIVLLHTTAWPSWSNLSETGLFPEMLQRLLALSSGVGAGAADHPLPPIDLLDGYGHLEQPGGIVESLPPTPALSTPISVLPELNAATATPIPAATATALVPGPRHPPGTYGDETGRVSFNLAPTVRSFTTLTLPNGARNEQLGAARGERDLQPYLLLAALLLLLSDLAIVLTMRARSGRSRPGRPRSGTGGGVVAAALALLLLFAGSAKAQDAKATLDAALRTRLAYVLSGDQTVDETSRAGLAGLTKMLGNRTTASFGAPVGVEPGRDPLAVFPLLYWPVTPLSGALSNAARDAVNDYMHHGGMILFDTRDGGNTAGAMTDLGEGLDIPPLTVVTDDHVLTRSFYLLKELPGRYTGSPVYVADGGDTANDDVSPVVIGANDWAAAWAMDQRGQPMYAVVPGGERQRELAYRFGVNLVMYALTGNYKADQVHLPTIMQRLGQ